MQFEVRSLVVRCYCKMAKRKIQTNLLQLFKKSHVEAQGMDRTYEKVVPNSDSVTNLIVSISSDNKC